MASEGTGKGVEGKVIPNLPANIRDSAGAVIRAEEFDNFLKNREAEKKDVDTDPYMAIIQQVLDAETPDAVLTPVDVLQARDLIGVNLVILGFGLNKSEYDAGSPFFATIDLIKGEGEDPIKVNCGHKKVIAQLVKLEELDAFPVAARFITRGVSRVGGTPMIELAKWEEPKSEMPF